MKVQTSSFLIVLILYSTILLSAIGQPVSDQQQIVVESIPHTIKYEIGETHGVVKNNERLEDYVIFADTWDEYVGLSERSDIIQRYPNLWAIKVKNQVTKIQQLMESDPDSIFPFDSFTYLQKPIVGPNSGYSSAISLDGNTEADIMNVKELWDLNPNSAGSGIVITILDNGVDFNHPGLQGQAYSIDGSSTYEINSADGETFPICADHGTLVAGSAAGTGAGSGGSGNKGNAYNASLYAVAAGCTPEGQVGGDFLKGLDWIANHSSEIDIVNISLGSNAAIWQIALRRLEAEGIIIVASAGNEGPITGSMHYPGGSINTIGVGATEGDEGLARFSSKGPAVPGIAKPDVIAPGVEITTTCTNGGYCAVDGTSFSSPLTAGAIATIISELNRKGVNYNPGTIKAALMKTADTFAGRGENAYGQGMVNAKAAFDLLTSFGNNPMLVEITPHKGPLQFQDILLKNIQTKIPYSVISSHPQKVSLSLTGNLSTIITIEPLSPNEYSQIAYLNINTNDAVVGGLYTGQIIATVGTDQSISEFTFTVGGEPIALALFDRGHTNWDQSGQDIIGGSNTGGMVDVAKQNGIWVEESETKLTPALLSGYNILWMPDPLSLVSEGGGFAESEYPNPLYQDEIDAIVDFVNGGGSLLVDFNGFQGGGQGTNATGINALISNFDITTSTTGVEVGSPSAAKIYNVSSIVRKVDKKISHAGNFLSAGSNASVIAEINDKPTIATYDQPGGGRVLVTSTNFWMDNFGVTGRYPGAGGPNDLILSSNVWKWFTQTKRIHPISSSVTKTKIEAEFKITDNSLPASDPEVSLRGTFGIQEINIIKIDEGHYKFTYNIQADGIYIIQAVYGNDYLRWEIKVDTTPPVIIPYDENQNLTGFIKGRKLFLKFNVTDNLDDLNKGNFNASLEGNFSAVMTISYLDDQLKLTITLSADVLTNTSYHWYILNIFATDTSENMALVNYWFFIGDNEPEPPPIWTPPPPLVTLPPITEITTITENTTVIMTNSDGEIITTVLTSGQILVPETTKDGDDSGILFPFVSLLFGGLVLITVARRRKKH